MSAKEHVAMIQSLHEKAFGTAEKHALAERLAREKAKANAEIAEHFANLHMPDDIRARAKAWGVEAWATLLWNNAFLAGYREAMRDRGEKEGGEG